MRISLLLVLVCACATEAPQDTAIDVISVRVDRDPDLKVVYTGSRNPKCKVPHHMVTTESIGTCMVVADHQDHDYFPCRAIGSTSWEVVEHRRDLHTGDAICPRCRKVVKLNPVPVAALTRRSAVVPQADSAVDNVR